MSKKTTKSTNAEAETVDPKDYERRQKERLERLHSAVRIIKRLAAKKWRNEWILRDIDWLEAQATALREEAEAKKAAEKKNEQAA